MITVVFGLSAATAVLPPPVTVAAVITATTGTSIPAHRRDPIQARLPGLVFRCFAADRMVMPPSP
ncbi:MAG: hypothetical protein WBF75_23630 [Pseudonocardiaceae bacterium]